MEVDNEIKKGALRHQSYYLTEELISGIEDYVHELKKTVPPNERKDINKSSVVRNALEFYFANSKFLNK